MDNKQTLLTRIRDKELTSAVIGLGYVGLPLVVEFGRVGFSVIGVDVDREKVEALNAGRSYILDVESEEIKRLRAEDRLTATTEYAALGECDTVNICVPTPLRKTRDPDLSYVVSAVEAIAENMKRPQLIVLESTTYPGTTSELVQPILERSGLKAGEDFFLAFSPERVDPGPAHAEYSIRTVPKVVGGVTPNCNEVAVAFYEEVVDTVVGVSNSQAAELVKLLENTYRSVNIGLVNELALMCHALGINVWEVIDAAATKPYGFQPFYPGPGLGGHCIPIDPFYLAWKARVAGFEPRFIELAGQINGSMPQFVLTLITNALNSVRKAVNGSRVHVLGVAYKRDVGDTRESPALDIMIALQELGAELSYTDPYVPRLKIGDRSFEHVDLQAAPLADCDCVVIITDHSNFDWGRIGSESPLIVDTRNALKSVDDAKIWHL